LWNWLLLRVHSRNYGFHLPLPSAGRGRWVPPLRWPLPPPRRGVARIHLQSARSYTTSLFLQIDIRGPHDECVAAPRRNAPMLRHRVRREKAQTWIPPPPSLPRLITQYVRSSAERFLLGQTRVFPPKKNPPKYRFCLNHFLIWNWLNFCFKQSSVCIFTWVVNENKIKKKSANACVSLSVSWYK